MSIAVVTGAAGGLGRAIAQRLAADGFELLLVDRAPEVREVARALGATTCEVDITAAEGREEIARAAGPRVGCLVNNAGVNRDGRATKLSDADFLAVVQVDLVGPALLAQALQRALSGGSVVNIASRAALGNFGQANYVAAKSGLIGLTRALAQRWAPDVRVNAVAPGLVSTPMTDAMPPEVLDKLVERIPAGRIGEPDDIALAVAHLVSPGAAYVTGQVHFVCGGRSIA